MTRDEGNLLLDKLKEGQTFSYDQITAALVATGDIAGWREAHLVGSLAAGMRSQGLDQAVQVANQGTGPTGSGFVVAGNAGRDIKSQGTSGPGYVDPRYEQGKK